MRKDSKLLKILFILGLAVIFSGFLGMLKPTIFERILR